MSFEDQQGQTGWTSKCALPAVQAMAEMVVDIYVFIISQNRPGLLDFSHMQHGKAWVRG